MANRDLTPWAGGRSPNPFIADPFSSFRREMDRLFDDFLIPAEGRSFGGSNGGGAMRPSLDLAETDKAYTVTAELPGLEQKDVELTLRDNALVLSGEKRQEHEEQNGGRRYTERTFGRFERVVPLEADVDVDKVEARFKNGVLTVTLPKNPQAQEKSRRIEIRPQ